MADSSDIERRVGAYYSERIAEHGPTARGVDWNSEGSQRLRFQQLLKVAPEGGAFSLNDFGCGYGGLVDHLDALDRDVRYHGHDISDQMVAAARERLADRPEISFGTDATAMPVADVTVASGIFNVLAGTDEAEWRDYVRSTVETMAGASTRGIAFNMLTSYSDPEYMTDRLHYADPAEVFDWCKRELSKQVALLHDYGLYEFTVIVRFEDKDGAAA